MRSQMAGHRRMVALAEIRPEGLELTMKFGSKEWRLRTTRLLRGYRDALTCQYSLARAWQFAVEYKDEPIDADGSPDDLGW